MIKVDMLPSMRIDSCRNCGKQLTVNELCSNCSQPICYQCDHCKHFVDDPVHLHGTVLMH